MNINTQSLASANASKSEPKAWVGNSKIPVPGQGGIKFKDVAAAHGALTDLKMGALQKTSK
jgi:hypothetical protein